MIATSKTFLFILILFLGIICAVVIEEDEFYCKMKKEKFRICRRCPDISGRCPTDPEDCSCDNIELWNGEKFVGGSGCQDGFCYISIDRTLDTCSDLDYYNLYDDLANEVEKDGKLWHHFAEDFERSEEACLPENKRDMKIGNEEKLSGVKIIHDFLHVYKCANNGSCVEDENTPLTFNFDEAQECLEECHAKCGKCGAWSFDETKGVCYLHTVDSCCGQREKQETNPQFTSGYYCNHCWSTKNDCPCDLKERLKVPLTEECKGVNQHSNEGAVTPQLTSSVGLLRVDEIELNIDLCAPEWRTFKREPFCRDVKPQCKSAKNINGTCLNPWRCRSRAWKDNHPLC